MAESMTSLKREMKKNAVNTIVSFAVGIVSCVLGSLVEIFYLISLFAFIAVICFLIELKRIRIGHCLKCGSKYDYLEDVFWEEICSETRISKSSSDSKGIHESIISTVEITCECACCGHEKTFEKKYTVATIYNNGAVKEHNLETFIRKYFK